jgi:two-component system response regulator RegA
MREKDAENARSLLLVEDDEALRLRLARALRGRGYAVVEAADGDAALAAASSDPPEYAIVDLRMPGPSGLEVVRRLHELEPATVIVVLTGYGSIATALEAVKLGARHYLTKPSDADALVKALEGDAADASGTAPIEAPSLARVEWEHIQRVLTDCRGSVSQAARVLGLHRRSLQRKLAKYPVSR